MTRTCPGCGRRFPGRRNKKTCSSKCRKRKSREGLNSWAEVESELKAMGVEAARKLAASDDTFKDYLISALEQYEEAHPPTGAALDNETLTLITSGGFHIGEAPLPPSNDIDAAEASGDWSAMEAEAAVMLGANKAMLKHHRGRWPGDVALIESASYAARLVPGARQETEDNEIVTES